MTLHTTLGTVTACSDPQRTREAPELTLSTPWTDPTRQIWNRDSPHPPKPPIPNQKRSVTAQWDIPHKYKSLRFPLWGQLS